MDSRAPPQEEDRIRVRYITNHSSGRMGYSIAKICALRGGGCDARDRADGSGAAALFVEVVPVVSARDMYEAVTARSGEMDIIIKAAAVADYRPAVTSDEKIKKAEKELAIAMERTDDILGYLGAHKKDGQFLCGFSMETQNMLENSRAKLRKKNLDMIVANNLKVEGAGFGTDTNVVTIITPETETELAIMSKEQVAVRLLDEILARL